MCAILSPDGTVSGRDRRTGHLLWRQLAPHRIARRGLSLGEYLLVAPEGSRVLEAYRWADGSSAGSFSLVSEDATFASAPLAARGRVLVLAVESPRPETRLIALGVEDTAQRAGGQ